MSHSYLTVSLNPDQGGVAQDLLASCGPSEYSMNLYLQVLVIQTGTTQNFFWMSPPSLGKFSQPSLLPYTDHTVS